MGGGDGERLVNGYHSTDGEEKYYLMFYSTVEWPWLTKINYIFLIARKEDYGCFQ